MPWYVIVSLLVFLLAFLVMAGVETYHDVKRIKARIRQIKQQEDFFKYGSEWFYYELYGTRK